MRALGLASLGLALSVASQPALAATPKDALVMAWNLDAIITLDPAQIAEVNGGDIMGNVCDTLVTLDYKDVAQFRPKMAESWAASADGRTITITLRPDLKFPSGRAATADDLAWSMQRVLKLNFGNSANLTEWGFTKENAEKTIRATGPRTLEVSLPEPYPLQLLLYGVFSSNVSVILDREQGEKNAKETTSATTGSRPTPPVSAPTGCGAGPPTRPSRSNATTSITAPSRRFPAWSSAMCRSPPPSAF